MLVSALVLVTSITLASAASRHRQGLRGPPPSGRPLPSEQWLDQRLDHFRVTERRTWKQRWVQTCKRCLTMLYNTSLSCND